MASYFLLGYSYGLNVPGRKNFTQQTEIVSFYKIIRIELFLKLVL